MTEESKTPILSQLKQEPSETHCYFRGKVFFSLEELFEYQKEWGQKPLDIESAHQMMEELQRDILYNLFIREFPFSNQEFLNYAIEMFDLFVSRLTAKELYGRKKEQGDG